LVASEGRNDGGLVGQDDLVIGGWWEEALEKGNSRVEDDGAFHACLNADLDLSVVHEVRLDTFDVRWRAAVEVSGADLGTEKVGFDLASKEVS